MLQKHLSSPLAAILTIIVITFGVYANSLGGNFVYDDLSQIAKNPWIQDIRHIPDILLSQAWGFEGASSNYYRPLAFLIYMVDYHLFGFDPWGFHLTNVLMHTGVSVLVFITAMRIFQLDSGQTITREFPSQQVLWPLIAALLFATHPINSEPVTWISSLSDIAFTLFYLLAFLAYMKGGNAVNRVLAPIFFFIACLGKETALTLPIMLFAYDALIRRDVNLSRQGILRLLKKYLPFIIVAIAYLAIRMNAIGGFAPMQAHKLPSVYVYVINILSLFSLYLGKLVLPTNLNAFHVFHPIPSLMSLKGFVGVVATLCYIGAFFRFVQTNRVLAFSLIWIAIPLLPVLYIPALGENIFTERYLYLPSVGFAMLVSAIGLLSIARFRKLSATIPLAAASLLLLVCLYALGTVNRIPAWESNLTLWTDAKNKSPNASTAHNNLASVLYNEGKFDAAIQELNIAIQLKPDNAHAHYGLGAVYAKLNRVDDAIYEYSVASKLNPSNAATHHHLGLAYAEKGQWDNSINSYKKALELKPDYFDTHLAIGVAYQKKKRPDRAISQFQAAVKLRPSSMEAHHNLGFVYAEQGLLDQAVNEYKAALRINQNYALAHHNLGVAYGLKKAFDLAIDELESALRLTPDDASIFFDLGITYANKGEPEKAIRALQQTLNLRPDHVSAKQLLRSLQDGSLDANSTLAPH